MMKILLAALLALLPLGAEASNCSSNPFTFINGQTADATQVMSNFNNLLNCANNNLAHNGANSDITSLTGLSTPLAASEGGTGVAAPTANSLLLGNGASALQRVAPSTQGNLLISSGGTWISAVSPSTTGNLLISSGGTWVSGVGIRSTWVPVDQSGAALALTVNDASVSQVGKHVAVAFSITYPVTANGNNAAISLPVQPVILTGLDQIFPIISGTSATNVVVRVNNAGSLTFLIASAATVTSLITNASLSGVTISGAFTYIAQ